MLSVPRQAEIVWKSRSDRAPARGVLCITLIREKATRTKEATSVAAAVAAQPEGGRVMYEGALFRFPAARVSSYASASRKLFPALARGTSVHGPPPSHSLSLSFGLSFSSSSFSPARDL